MALITSRYTMDKQDRRSGAIWPIAPICWARSACPTPRSRPMPERKSRPTFCSCKSARQERARGEPGGAGDHRHARRPDCGQRIFRPPSRDDAGQMRLEGHDVPRLEPTLAGELTPELLARPSSIACPRAHYIPQGRSARPPPPEILSRRLDGVKDGAYAERDGAICHPQRQRSFEPPISESAAASAGMLAVRDAVRWSSRPSSTTRRRNASLRGPQTAQRIYDSFVCAARPCLLARERQGLCRRSRSAAPALA
jgi:hypothetical protein